MSVFSKFFHAFNTAQPGWQFMWIILIFGAVMLAKKLRAKKKKAAKKAQA